jgi:hypothetical protein
MINNLNEKLSKINELSRIWKQVGN